MHNKGQQIPLSTPGTTPPVAGAPSSPPWPPGPPPAWGGRHVAMEGTLWRSTPGGTCGRRVADVSGDGTGEWEHKAGPAKKNRNAMFCWCRRMLPLI